MGHGLVAVYTCSSRYGPSHPCSALQFYSTWIAVPIVIVVGLFSHQGYRYRRRRRSSFSSDDTVQGEALLASSRREAGLTSGGPVLPGQAAGFTTPGASPGGPPVGWYPDPDRPGQQRYWYGDRWAPSLAPGESPGTVPGVVPGAASPGGQPVSPRPDDAPGWGAASY